MGERFIANLGLQAPLTDEDRRAGVAMLGAPYPVRAGGEIVVEDSPQTDYHVILEGQAFRYKALADGRRQIVGFSVPGDVLDFARFTGATGYGVGALMPCRIAQISRARLDEKFAEHPSLAKAFWRLSLTEASMTNEWLVSIGRRSAQSRVAHLLCEVHLRLRAVGAASGMRSRFPATQNHLADAVGLSAVHLNRVLQKLRSDRLIDLKARELLIHDWPGLAEIGEFDPAYLRLPRALQAELGAWRSARASERA